MRILSFLIVLCPIITSAAQSTCYGTSSNGRLENGVKLPASGSNFVGYSALGRLTGRTYVHAEVAQIVVAAYEALQESHPDKVYKYAETGLKKGGRFKPHKTHRNGLSVDFMTPMISAQGLSTHLPTHVFNKFGYSIELDSKGRYKGLETDFTALAAHIVSLDRAARRKGYRIRRVIFDPELQPELFVTKYGSYLREYVQFSTKRSWVRHDEHYHVDFEIPCKIDR